MPYVMQAKGKQHIRNISNAAWNMYRLKITSLGYIDCLKIVLEDHRKLVEDEIRMGMQTDEDHECL